MSFLAPRGIAGTPVDPNSPSGVLVDPTEMGGSPGLNDILIGDGSGGWVIAPLPGGGGGLAWQGDWSAATAYSANDVVRFGLTSYVALQASTGQSPPNPTYWAPLTDTAADGVVTAVLKASPGTLSAGTPVYLAGYNATTGQLLVEAADSSSALTMPALGVLLGTVTDSSAGFAARTGKVLGIDTSAWAAGTDLFVGTGGTLTAVRPAGEVQPIARVLVSDIAAGALDLFGVGHQAILPSLQSGNIWLGDGSGSPAETPFAATQAEVDAGVKNDAAVTPLTLANNPRLPTQNENDALAGTVGTPSAINPYVTAIDPILDEKRYALEFRSNTVFGSVRYMLRAQVAVTSVPVILPAAATVIGMTISVNAPPGGGRTYEARVILDPGGADTVVASLALADPNVSALTRGLAGAIPAGSPWGVMLVRTAGTGSSGFTRCRVEVDLDMP